MELGVILGDFFFDLFEGVPHLNGLGGGRYVLVNIGPVFPIIGFLVSFFLSEVEFEQFESQGRLLLIFFFVSASLCIREQVFPVYLAG